MKRRLAVLIAVLAMLFSACGTQKANQQDATAAKENRTVGICLPGTQQQWQACAQQLSEKLENAGCQVLTEYAGGDALLQQSQVQTLLSRPVGCLVVSAVDSLTLSSILDQAVPADIPVIAYDRMLMYTQGVTACVATDGYAAGRQMAQYIIEKNQLDSAPKPLSIEFFMGAPTDSNALRLYQGLMELLQSYLDSGKLQCRSGRISFEDTCTQGALTQGALERCFDYLSQEYENTAPDILCTADNLLAQGCIQALESFAFTPDKQWPMITGVGTAPEAAQQMADGKQTMTIHTDTQELTEKCAAVVQQVLAGQQLTASAQHSNGAKEVPCVLQTPVVVDAEHPLQKKPD